MTDALERCFSPAMLGSLRLRNRLLQAAMSEGKTVRGAPGEALIRFHERVAAGGVAMATLAYCAAEADGRLDEDGLYMHEGVREPLQRWVAAVTATGARACGQLVHAGAFTKNRTMKSRPLGPSAGINRLGLLSGRARVVAMSPLQIEQRVAAFGRAAAFMKRVGFDAIELHFGHGYAINQFLSPKTNKRTDRYGGSLRNRLRFGLEVLAAVRDAVGESFPLLGKISMTDGDEGENEESVEIAAALEAGSLDTIVCSGGSSSHNPMLIFHGDSIARGLVEHEPSGAMRLLLRAAGPVMFRRYPYRELYFFERAKRIRDRVQCGVCYIGGVSTTRSIQRVMAAGFDFIQLGRVLLHDPDFPRRARSDADHRSGCTHCNRCVGTIAAPGGVYCVERPLNFARDH